MNRRSALTLAGLAALGANTSLEAKESNSEVEKAVLALEDQWLEAEKQHKSSIAVPLMAKSYVSTGPDSKLEDKTQSLADMDARHYATAEYEDMKAAVFGGTAIVRGVFKGTGTEKDRKPFKEKLRFTDTWIKIPSGQWQCVASQYTAVPGA